MFPLVITQSKTKVLLTSLTPSGGLRACSPFCRPFLSLLIEALSDFFSDFFLCMASPVADRSFGFRVHWEKMGLCCMLSNTAKPWLVPNAPTSHSDWNAIDVIPAGGQAWATHSQWNPGSCLTGSCLVSRGPWPFQMNPSTSPTIRQLKA